MSQATRVPPTVEVRIPVSIEGSVCGIGNVVHLLISFVEEVVQFVTAVVVTTSFAWARWVAFHSNGVEFVSACAAAEFVSDIAASIDHFCLGGDCGRCIHGYSIGHVNWAAIASLVIEVQVWDLNSTAMLFILA